MNWKLAFVALVLGATFVATPGCSVDATSEDAEGDAEEASTSEQDLSAFASKLVGAYAIENSGPMHPTVEGLVLQADGTYFADVDTGLRCITAPCPSHVRLAGRFSATASYLRLNPPPGEQPTEHHGRYKYTLTPAGKKLTLTRPTLQGWSNKLARRASYCKAADECWGQNLIVPACLGSFTCSDDNTCAFSCGVILPPSSSVWPSDATKLVATAKASGFQPPPPPGSVCARGAREYSLDVATRSLSWERCAQPSPGAPLQVVTGQKTITATQLESVHTAMQEVTLSTADTCGADKGLLTIAVTAASAPEKEYTDSFYSCWDNRTFVDNIGAAFRVLGDLAN